MFVNRSTDSHRVFNYVDKLSELEAVIEKQKNSIRFYTPAAPVIGLNSVNVHSYHHESTGRNQVDETHVFEEDQSGETEEIIDEEFMDAMSEEERGDVLDELEDSTEES